MLCGGGAAACEKCLGASLLHLDHPACKPLRLRPLTLWVRFAMLLCSKATASAAIRPRREKRRRSRCGTLAPFIVQVHQLKIHGVNAARNSSASRRKKLLCGEDLCGLLNGKREGFLFEKRFPSPMQST